MSFEKRAIELQKRRLDPMDRFRHYVPCYNCGHQYVDLIINHPDADLAGECFSCYNIRCPPTQELNYERPIPLYHYFLTFTKSPSSTKEELLDNLKKLSVRPALRIIYLQYCLEHWDDNSNPHIHVYMTTHRRFDKSRVKAYTRQGYIDVKVAKGNLDEIDEYMGKENEIIILINLNNAKT